MIQKGTIKLDEKKLNEEDRRFLISDVTQRYITNEQMKLSNYSLLISIMALFIAFTAIMLSLDIISQVYKIIFICIIVIPAIMFYRNFKKSNKEVEEQIGGLNHTHSNLFLHHFKYAIKSKT